MSLQSVYQKMSEFPSDIESHVQIIHNEENGLPEVIITHQYIYGLETSTHEILRNCCQKNGHKNGNGWDNGLTDVLSAYVNIYNNTNSKVL